MLSRSPIVRLAGLVVAFVLAALPATAQQVEEINGALSDATTGPLMNGFEYHVVGGGITVHAGESLTIQDGAIIKFEANRGFRVLGSVNCAGNGPRSIVFTSLNDSSVGQMSGSGNPAPGDWMGLDVSGNGAFFRGIQVRYAGALQGTGVLVRGEGSTFEESVVEDCEGQGFDLGSSALPFLRGCAVYACTGTAFARCSFRAVERFNTLAAEDNGKNWVDVVTQLAAGETYSIQPQNGIDGVIHRTGILVIPPSSQLTIGGGTIVKMAPGAFVNARGPLVLNGTQSQPVTFTSERDDLLGGDGDGDGGAVPALPGDWGGIRFQSTSSSGRVTGLLVAYAGFGGGPGLTLSGTDGEFFGVTVFRSGGNGIDVSETARPMLDGILLDQNFGAAIGSAPIQALPGFQNLTASFNGLDQLRVTSAALDPTDVVEIRPENLIFDCAHFTSPISVPLGATLRLYGELGCKMAPGTFVDVFGELDARGEFDFGANEKRYVHFTSERDDLIGGDTNGDGVSFPSPGGWRGVTFRDTSDGSGLSTVRLAYGGAGPSSPAIRLQSAAVTVSSCLIESFAGNGIDAGANTEVSNISFNTIEGCGGEAITNVEIQSIEDFEFNKAKLNGKNWIKVVGFAITGDVHIQRKNGINDTVVLWQGAQVAPGAELRVASRVVIKTGPGADFRIAGRLDIDSPFGGAVVITDLRDDSRGGDTNGDGDATSPAPGWWRGVSLTSTTDDSSIKRLRLYYGGGGSTPQLAVRTPRVVIRRCASKWSASSGMLFDASPGLVSVLLAYENAADGIELRSGSFDLSRVTAVANGGCGIRAGTNWFGVVRNAYAAFNGVGDFCGFDAGEVKFSNGDPALAGSDGNVDVDPGFVDLPNGDLSLLPNSLMIDIGDPALPPDPDGSRSDIGGVPFNRCEPRVFCEQPVLGTCEPTLTTEGLGSMTSSDPFWIRLEDAPTQSFAIFFYGVGAETNVPVVFGNLCVSGLVMRTPPVPSGGQPQFGSCLGLFEIDFNAWAQSGMDPALVAGSTAIGHFWYRDGSAQANARFSSAVEIPMCP
ncbi:MAG: hypothetical protein AAGA20_07955 [Planctomycetota bacterium]